jgi:hypothetical protein
MSWTVPDSALTHDVVMCAMERLSKPNLNQITGLTHYLSEYDASCAYHRYISIYEYIYMYTITRKTCIDISMCVHLYRSIRFYRLHKCVTSFFLVVVASIGSQRPRTSAQRYTTKSSGKRNIDEIITCVRRHCCSILLTIYLY